MNTLEYLDAVKKRLGISTEYAVAKALKVRPSTVYGYHTRNGQMDDEVAVRVAEILGMHPGIVILDMHRERAKTPQERTLWQEIFEGFRTLLAPAKGVGIA